MQSVHNFRKKDEFLIKKNLIDASIVSLVIYIAIITLKCTISCDFHVAEVSRERESAISKHIG